MTFTTVTEMPLRLHRVERDPFIDSTPRHDPRSGDLPADRRAPAAPPMVLADVGRTRARRAELAA